MYTAMLFAVFVIRFCRFVVYGVVHAMPPLSSSLSMLLLASALCDYAKAFARSIAKLNLNENYGHEKTTLEFTF